MRLTCDSVKVQVLFFSFNPQRFTVPMGEGVDMRSETAKQVRHWGPEVELMPSTSLEDQLRLRARELISDGRLRCIPHYRTWGGRGNNEPCALCDVVIKGDEVEYEIESIGADSARLYRFHFLCHDAWQQECAEAE
jgi:hypothetical protein